MHRLQPLPMQEDLGRALSTVGNTHLISHQAQLSCATCQPRWPNHGGVTWLQVARCWRMVVPCARHVLTSDLHPSHSCGSEEDCHSSLIAECMNQSVLELLIKIYQLAAARLSVAALCVSGCIVRQWLHCASVAALCVSGCIVRQWLHCVETHSALRWHSNDKRV
jgi:hypothetical protein